MATPPVAEDRAAVRDSSTYPAEGSGWLLFAGIMIMMVGILNIIYGIAAIGDAHFFVNNADYIISSLNTWGWFALILGILQVVASISLMGGGTYGRWFGMFAASLSAIASLLAIPAYPFWSLAIFALDLWIIYGLAVYGEEDSASYAPRER